MVSAVELPAKIAAAPSNLPAVFWRDGLQAGQELRSFDIDAAILAADFQKSLCAGLMRLV